ncbi:MAG TPA: chorismate synthase [Bacteroidales bacterium]|nr:chorismate synthase [Bacteroidales bacterium]
MAGNSIGEIFRLITFGESHSLAVGGIVDGCPAGLKIDFDLINNQLIRRKTNLFSWSSERDEPDNVVFVSGINKEGVTLGTPIAFYVLNENANSYDYEKYKYIYRPSHADYTYEKKYGIRDYRGGGRAAARETLARVVGGSIASMLLKKETISLKAFTCQVGPYKYTSNFFLSDLSILDQNPLACPDLELADRMINYLQKIKREKDSVGAVVACLVKGIQPGLGEPVFDKLQADLAKAMMSIPAAKGFEYGLGFKASSMKGSEHNDYFVIREKTENGEIKIGTLTNNSGGIQGGISNGEDILFKVAFKPIPSIGITQNTVDNKGRSQKIELQGRFDHCVVPRVLPVVEAMAAIVIADHLLRFKAYDNFYKINT